MNRVYALEGISEILMIHMEVIVDHLKEEYRC